MELNDYIEAKVIRRESLIAFISSFIFECLNVGLFVATLFLTNYANEKNSYLIAWGIVAAILWIIFGNVGWWSSWKDRVKEYFGYLYKLKLHIGEYENGFYELLQDLKNEIKSYETNRTFYAKDEKMLESLKIRKEYAQSLLDNL